MKRAKLRGTLTAVFEKHGKWYAAYVEEIPGVNTQGRTLAEARRNLKEALALVLEVNGSLSQQHSGRKLIRESI